MKIIKYLIALVILNSCNNKDVPKIDEALNCTENWFNAWKLVSKDVFKLEEQSPVRYVFFDSLYVYTTSPLTGKGGKEINGPQLFDENQTWFKKEHKGLIILPDSSEIKVQMMIYASPIKEEKVKAYFVMPLLSFWVQQKVDGHGIGLEKLTAGVFTHEFSHTTQLESFDKFGQYFETYQKKFGAENFGDDMMQNMYEKDTLIKSTYLKEIKLFENASNSNESEKIKNTEIALTSFYDKHKLLLNRDKKDLKTIDDIWLTMEGVGQYAMYEYFINPKGANLSKSNALKAMKTRWWSQEEGFAMFQLLAKYKKPQIWAKDFFSADMKTIIEVLEQEIKTTNR